MHDLMMLGLLAIASVAAAAYARFCNGLVLARADGEQGEE